MNLKNNSLNSNEQIKKILDYGSKDQKIQAIQSTSESSDAKIMEVIISAFDDPDIE